jgi:hypothetical protein
MMSGVIWSLVVCALLLIALSGYSTLKNEREAKDSQHRGEWE